MKMQPIKRMNFLSFKGISLLVFDKYKNSVLACYLMKKINCQP